MEYTKNLVKLNIPEEISRLRKDALERWIPVADDETVNFLLLTVKMCKPKKILEIGTAIGLSSILMALSDPEIKITTIECDEERFFEAKHNFASFGVSKRITSHLGDAGEILPNMDGSFDFIFLDGPKAQYEKYLPDLKRLLAVGGTLFSDDVLLYGWVDGRAEPPKKHRVLAEKIRSYLTTLTSDSDFITTVADIGDGVAVSLLTKREGKK